MSLSLCPLQPEDESFSFQVYASTRADEMALVPWSVAQKQAFLQMQSTAQRQSYAQQFPAAQWNIILRDAEPIGRLIVDRADDVILLMDIALLPEYRNHGIGTALIRDLMAEARQSGRPLRLHVEIFNPALHLYDRLGFHQIDASGIYYELEWRAASEPVA